jgi:hypothetical protein
MLLNPRSHLRWIPGTLVMALLMALLAAPPAAAQQGQRDERELDDPTNEDESAPIFSFDISPQLLANGLDLLVEKRLAKDYDLDDYQYEQMRQVLHEHVPRFLKEHQKELERLFVEWTEVISAGEPPDSEYVAQWAQRALPTVEAFQGMVGSMATDMREFMTDEQQVLLDGYLAVFDTGTRTLNNRLQVFAQGGFDPERDWLGYKEVRHRSPEEARQLRQEMEEARWAAMDRSRQAGRGAGAGAAPPSDAELVADALASPPRRVAKTVKSDKDEWTRYVEDFIRRYNLNDEQQQKAHSLLQQQLERREHYLRRKDREVERIKNMFKQAQGDAQKTALAETAYRRLNEPIDTMFQKLKEKLETLPTRDQRRAAALAETQKPEQRKSAPKAADRKDRPQ